MGNFNYIDSGNTLHSHLVNQTTPQTVWQKIYLHLVKLGYDVYSAGQKRDKCQNSYVVVRESGVHAMVGNVAGYKTFDIIIYHPIDNYSTMELYIENIKDALKDIYELRPTGNETPCIIDSEVQAYTTSVLYQQFKKLRR
ncbi:hypothetical protein [Clostridium botulinum]|uniref:hypothetical protein n=1 Tax=Clostridium botulinum TaxID=1491 RepID=UPI001401ADB4|nr:hypothetical protein [Clostridium botulinum]MBY6918198.1 hypothetical protein [Clostridium botulinum]NFQ39454.1 hypothetical protein [Clostridium botulinum]